MRTKYQSPVLVMTYFISQDVIRTSGIEGTQSDFFGWESGEGDF